MGVGVGFVAAVRFRLSICGLLFAWLCASGGLLDVAQVFAWSRMFSGYAQSMPLREAVRKTFDSARPCDLCVAVLKAREASADSADAPVVTSAEIEKVVLIAQRVDAVVIAPVLEPWPAAGHAWADGRVEPVPMRPPRVV